MLSTNNEMHIIDNMSMLIGTFFSCLAAMCFITVMSSPPVPHLIYHKPLLQILNGMTDKSLLHLKAAT